MATSNSIMGNGLWSVLGAGAGRLLNLVAMIALARELTIRDFGYFGLLQASIGLLGVFAGVSLGATATRFVAELRASDSYRAGQIIGMILSVMIALLGVVLSLLIVYSREIVKLIVGAEQSVGLEVAMPAAGLLLAVNSLRALQDAIFCGLERFRDASFLKLVDGLAVLAILPFLADAFGVAGALFGMASGSFVALALGALLLRRRLMEERIFLRFKGAFSERKILFSFSLPALMSNLIGTPALWFGLWFLGHQSGGVERVAIYSAAYQWYGPLTFVPMVLNSVGMPRLVSYWTSGGFNGFLKLWSGLNVAALILVAIPGVIVVCLRDSIMNGYGVLFAPGEGVLLVLVMAAPLHVISNLGAMSFQCFNRVWLELLSSLVWAVFYVGVCVVLIPNYGSIGLAAALLLSYFFLASIRVLVVVFFLIVSRSNSKFVDGGGS